MDSVLPNILWQFVRPSNLCFLLIIIATVFCFTKRIIWGRLLLSVTLVFLFLVALLPIPEMLMLPLENRYQASLPAEVTGIIVLGGTFMLDISEARNQVSFFDSAERLTVAVQLKHLYPDSQLVFTGGGKFVQELSEADVAAWFFRDMALDTDQILFEDKSVNTRQNAAFSKALVQPEAGETWLLVTSALHMPRAVRIFHSRDWAVVPYPVDYQTDGKLELTYYLPIVWKLFQLDYVAREWASNLMYWLFD